MSERSIIRANERRQAQHRKRARRAAIGATAAVGAAVVLASSAQAANFEVNSGLDDGDGTCDAGCTIRDAVDDANQNGAGSDTITFAPSVSGTIVLQSGQLPVYSAMAIQGPGVDQLRISGDANQNNVPDAGDSRIFYADPNTVGADFDPVTISGLTLIEGFAGPAEGGAIFSTYANLTLDRVTVSDSYAGSGGGEGGGVSQDGGDLTITDSVFTDNYGEEQGGAVYMNDPDGAPTHSLVVRNTTMSGNVGEEGGGLYVEASTGSVLIADSTFSDNYADNDGGGVEIDGTTVSEAVIQNTTISGNRARFGGGGLFLDNDVVFGARIENSTIAGNVAGLTGTYLGGGIYRDTAGTPGPTTITSSIVADNTDSSGPNDLADDAPGAPPISTGFSLIENPGTVPLVLSPAGSNLLGLDPQLGVLSSNGGPTQTQLITATSPAVDAGIANGLATDQRGLPRTQQQPGANPAGGDGTDIGAVELPDTALEGAAVRAKKKQKAKGKRIKVVVKVGAAESVDALASGSIKAGRKSYPLKDARASGIAAGATATLTLKPKAKRSSKKIAKVLGAGKKAKAKVVVLLTDAAGNTDSENVGVTLQGKPKKKG